MAKESKTGVCSLCWGYSQLVDSHIVPDFLAKPMRQKDGFYFRMSTNADQKTRKRQKFVTEYLLCAKCDNELLSEYENHLRKVFFGGHPMRRENDSIVPIFSGHDYLRLKNALLSILWRMSLSSEPFYREVALGSKHEERLRQILLNNETTDLLEFPIHVVSPRIQGADLCDLSIAPDYVSVDGNRLYRCLVSGLLFTFLVGSAPVQKEYAMLSLKPTELPIPIVDIRQIPFLHKACLDLAKAEAKRKNPPLSPR